MSDLHTEILRRLEKVNELLHRPRSRANDDAWGAESKAFEDWAQEHPEPLDYWLDAIDDIAAGPSRYEDWQDGLSSLVAEARQLCEDAS